MKAKPIVMLAFSAALIGAYFFLARRASASTPDGAGEGAGFFDGIGDFFGDLIGGAVGDLSTPAAPKPGTPFTEVTQGPTFPGGGTTPLVLGAGATAGGAGMGPNTATPKGGKSPLPVVPAKPTTTGGTVLSPAKPAPKPAAPGRSTPVAPVILAKPTPRPVRAAQGVLGQTGQSAGKDRQRRALN